MGRIVIGMGGDGGWGKRVGEYMEVVCGVIMVVWDLNNVVKEGFLRGERV